MDGDEDIKVRRGTLVWTQLETETVKLLLYLSDCVSNVLFLLHCPQAGVAEEPQAAKTSRRCWTVRKRYCLDICIIISVLFHRNVSHKMS